jgi:hypothetical protein
MSHELISHSPDLKRLRDEGYEVATIGAYVLVGSIPYVSHVSESIEIAKGTLVAPLALTGDRTATPPDHVIHFDGDYPCMVDGSVITSMTNASNPANPVEGVSWQHSFSNKPPEGFSNYYDKFMNYIRIITAEAEAIDPDVDARTFTVIETVEPESPFHYLDTNSSRAEIDLLSARFEGMKVAIIGVGGTGSYVLDLVAKTSVGEIHIFDADRYLSHNAFRSPGAPSLAELNRTPTKVAYMAAKYDMMHKHIVPHQHFVEGEHLVELNEMDFVFICIDDGEAKKAIIDHLLANSVSCIDTGIGLIEQDGALTGSVRVTLLTPSFNGHMYQRISFADDMDDVYTQNIQTAELNSLNASLAVLKWKRLVGFYHDLEHEHHSVYETSVNKVINDEYAA